MESNMTKQRANTAAVGGEAREAADERSRLMRDGDVREATDKRGEMIGEGAALHERSEVPADREAPDKPSSLLTDQFSSDEPGELRADGDALDKPGTLTADGADFKRQVDITPRNNGRRMALVEIGAAALLLAGVLIASFLIRDGGTGTNLAGRNLAPGWSHLFGTDWLGRDMLTRTVKGLATSLQVGAIGASASALIAVLLGLAAAMGRRWDAVVSWLIDLFLSVPHLVTLILIAFVCGGGLRGVVLGIALTHWPSLARLIRAEVLQLQSADYIRISRRQGKSGWWVATRHMLPHLAPQAVVGFLMLFPHAILHEASITFLGLGLSPHQPAIGIILSESMRYLSTGMWWLALFPGLSLLLTVRMFDRIGNRLRSLLDPREHQN